MDSWRETAVWQRELNLMLCDDVEEWDEGVGGRLKMVGIYVIQTADSLFCLVETDIML